MTITDVKILVVAADRAIVDAAKAAFDPMGYQVVPANGISLGLFLAQKNLPDLILCQPRLAEGDGHSFLAEIKLDAELVPIPFVFVDFRNKSSTTDRDAAVTAGACRLTLLNESGSLDASELIPLIERRLLTRTKRQEFSPE